MNNCRRKRITCICENDKQFTMENIYKEIIHNGNKTFVPYALQVLFRKKN